MKARHGRLPEQGHTEGFGPFTHDSMQNRTAHANASDGGKIRFRAQAAANKGDAAKRARDVFGNRDSQLRECCATVGHQAFAAWLVDGRACSVGYHNSEALLARRDGRCQSSRAATDYEN